MFSNLENFLNAKSVVKEPENNGIAASSPNANDSWDLDLTYKPKSKSNLGNEGPETGAEFIPGKGQKMAAKRLKKIGDTLARGLVDTEKIEKRIARTKASKAVKASKNKSPPKRNGRALRSGQRKQHRFDVDSDLESTDSDDDIPIMNRRIVGCSPRRNNRPAHDPNTIVLDCDDEFFGGPAVAFSRNIAGANAISIEDSKGMKVSVKINNKIEHFEMNPFQKLSMLQSQISDKRNVPADHIVLMFKDKKVSEHETPNSIGYIQGLVIKALISDKMNKNTNTTSSNKSSADRLEIKIQAEGLKRPFITYINPTDQLITLAFACAEEFKCEADKVAIEFDGEFINFSETAEDLGLEGGELMDFFRKK